MDINGNNSFYTTAENIQEHPMNEVIQLLPFAAAANLSPSYLLNQKIWT